MASIAVKAIVRPKAAGRVRGDDVIIGHIHMIDQHPAGSSVFIGGQNISIPSRAIPDLIEEELSQNSTVKDYLTTATDEKN